MKPFRQLRFADLPERPRVSHPFFDTDALELRMESEPFGTMNVHYRKHGSGPPLLLVHGLMTASYSWRYVVEPLGERFTLYIPDLPGSGRTDKPDRDYHPDHVATWLAELQRQLGIRGCDVIGNSMGGYLCMRLALSDPDAIGRLVNLHSPGVPLARLHALRQALSIPGSFRLLRWLVHRNPQRWAHRNVHYYDETLKSLEEAREYASPLSTDAGVHAFGRILRETLDPRAMRSFCTELAARRDDGGGFPVPLLLLYAERDPMVPPAVGRRLAQLVPDAVFVSLPEASHFAHVDAVDRFLPPVLDFLSEP